MKRYLPLVAVLLLQLAVRLFINQWAFFIDDAAITFRYAQNLFSGIGLIYNAGEYVLGTTTPLYALLLNIPMAFGMPVWDASRILNILFDLGSTILIWKILVSINTENKWSPVPLLGALIYSISPYYVYYVMNGMETVVVSFFMLAAILSVIEKRRVIAGLILGLCILVRIDTAIFVLMLLLWIWWERKRIPLSELLWMAVILIPWVVFAYLYYGSPIPFTIAAKQATSSSDVRSVYDTFSSIMVIWNECFMPIYLFFPVAVFGIIRFYRNKFVIAITSWLVVYTVVNVLYSPPFPWYYLPPIPILSILIALGCGAIYSLLEKVLIGRNVRAIILIVTLIGITASTLPNWHGSFISTEGWKKRMHFWVLKTSFAKSFFSWFNDNISSDAVFCTTAPGIPGVFIDNKILDVGALVSPEVARFYYHRSATKAERLIVKHFKPDLLYLVSEKVIIDGQYIPLKKFNVHYGLHKMECILYGNPGSPYVNKLLQRERKQGGMLGDVHLQHD